MIGLCRCPLCTSEDFEQIGELAYACSGCDQIIEFPGLRHGN